MCYNEFIRKLIIVEIVENNILTQINMSDNERLEIKYQNKNFIIRSKDNDLLLEGVPFKVLYECILGEKQTHVKNRFDMEDMEQCFTNYEKMYR